MSNAESPLSTMLLGKVTIEECLRLRCGNEARLSAAVKLDGQDIATTPVSSRCIFEGYGIGDSLVAIKDASMLFLGNKQVS